VIGIGIQERPRRPVIDRLILRTAAQYRPNDSHESNDRNDYSDQYQ
jgi:hypothetical protein